MSFVKVHEELLGSTIWQEDNATRIAWLTLLAKSNRDGDVLLSIPGLAHVARITVEETEIALNKFMSPDPYSRTKEYEGRRIVEIDGGWHLLNYQKYREKCSIEERREKTRERVRRYRDKGKEEISENAEKDVTLCNADERYSNIDVTHCNADVTESNACNAMQRQRQKQKKEEKEKDKEKEPAGATAPDPALSDFFSSETSAKEALGAEEALRRAILQNKSDHRIADENEWAAERLKWARSLQTFRTRYGVTEERLLAVIEWLPTSPFWGRRLVISSARELCAKFEKLEADMRQEASEAEKLEQDAARDEEQRIPPSFYESPEVHSGKVPA